MQVWRKLSEDNGVVKLVECDSSTCISLFEEVLKTNEAANTRKIINDAQLPDSVSFYNIIGTSYETPYDVCISFRSETSRVDDLNKLCHTMPEYSYVDGDETVPTKSAKADRYAATARVGIKIFHRGLLSDKKLFDLVKQYLGVSEKSKSSSSSKVMDINFPSRSQLSTKEIF